MTDVLPIVAIFLSIASLVLSVLNYLRDRAQVNVWSDVLVHMQGRAPDIETPSLRIRIANLGRRPAVLLNLVMVAGKHSWASSIKAPAFESDEILDGGEAIKLLQAHSLAQNSVLKLMEGDVVDLIFWPDDCPCFIFPDVDPIPTAEKLYIEDCAGRRYRVKDDGKNLRKFFDAWSP